MASGSVAENQSRGASSLMASPWLYAFIPVIPGSSPSCRWKASEPTPLTGLRTSRTSIFEFRERSTTLSNDVGGGATTALAATLRMGTSRVKNRRVRLKPNPVPPTPTPPVSLDRSLDQRRTPGPRTPACLSPWITLGRTWLSLTSLQTLRVVNWILRRNPTHGLMRRGGDVREETTKSVAPTTIRRSSTELQHRFQTYHCRRWNKTT